MKTLGGNVVGVLPGVVVTHYGAGCHKMSKHRLWEIMYCIYVSGRHTKYQTDRKD